MSQITVVSKWGNSLAVRIPSGVAREARIGEGDSLSLAVGKDGSLVLRPSRRRYELSELVDGITAKNRHDETDWGPAVGKEIW